MCGILEQQGSCASLIHRQQMKGILMEPQLVGLPCFCGSKQQHHVELLAFSLVGCRWAGHQYEVACSSSMPCRHAVRLQDQLRALL